MDCFNISHSRFTEIRVIECELYQEADPERCQDCAGSDSGADGR